VFIAFIFKDTEPSSLQDSSIVRQKGGLLGPTPLVVPDPESIDAQAAYPYRHSAIAQVGSGPNCFQALVSSPGLLQNPIL
jgi:hypothetical protein